MLGIPTTSTSFSGSGYNGSSRQSLVDWKAQVEETVSKNRSRCVDSGGCLVEYETYELLRNPPNVNIDNKQDINCTVITIDSANRPGTLVEVVTCLAELGINVRKARISSDGGWFVDVFYLTEKESNGKVKDYRKLQSVLRQVLAASVEPTGSQTEICSTVFELSGSDRPGLLADITSFLSDNGCDVRSAAVWTHNGRVAFVFSVTEQGLPVKDQQKLKALQKRMLEKIQVEDRDNATIDYSSVTGMVHHERRLHKLLLQEERKRWKKQQSSLENFTDSEEDVYETTQSDSGTATIAPHSPNSTLLSTYESLQKPHVRIQKDHQRGYWFVEVTCKDRTKLFFDTVCTLSDLDSDIYHASIDERTGIGYQEYYVRPRWGKGDFLEEKAAELKHMLEMSIARRHPKGIKINVHGSDQFGLLAELTRVLGQASLCITRAKAMTWVDKGACDHTLYVLHTNGSLPNKEVVEQACYNIGGKQVRFGEGSHEIQNLQSDHKFSFSFLDRWNRELGGSYNSSYNDTNANAGR
eukprot:TRINITY_DN25664_c1_g1_i1.p1 TRINITY_DN25664_c1_g1~~TRINITY_DN25664_c1_g1_i1.p1  ORF type:complete len:525 (-),score=87.52 TRINITY_DN25664_c1_g1_i1:154-1728(-)